MLTIIHGDDTAASRTYFLQLKEKHPDTAIHEGQAVTITDLAQILEGGGLFSEEKTLFIENILTRKKNTTEYKNIINYLIDQSAASQIILWESKELERSSLTPFKNAAIKPFKLPQLLFTFLDAIKPGNGPQLLQLFHQTLNTMEAEAVFPMIVRQIRLLLALKEKPADIDEVKRMQDWQKSKLMNQARSFTTEQLVNIFCQLFVMEEGQKTGKLNTDLVTAIDMLLVEI